MCHDLTRNIHISVELMKRYQRSITTFGPRGRHLQGDVLQLTHWQILMSQLVWLNLTSERRRINFSFEKWSSLVSVKLFFRLSVCHKQFGNDLLSNEWVYHTIYIPVAWRYCDTCCSRFSHCGKISVGKKKWSFLCYRIDVFPTNITMRMLFLSFKFIDANGMYLNRTLYEYI